jgi:hypothetical protein
MQNFRSVWLVPTHAEPQRRSDTKIVVLDFLVKLMAACGVEFELRPAVVLWHVAGTVVNETGKKKTVMCFWQF